MVVTFQYHAHWQTETPATHHALAFRCIPLTGPDTAIRGLSVRFEPHITLTQTMDAFGNTVLSGYIPGPHTSYDLFCAGTVERFGRQEDTSPCPACYRLFTPLTMPGPGLRGLFGQLSLSGKEVRTQAEAILEALRAHISYVPGTTTTATTAEEAFTMGKGVCQDYAHSFLALCRMAGIPCRYVAGIFQGGNETHAWVQIHDGYKWLTIDPTHGTYDGKELLALSRGRDFRDAAMEKGVFRGGGAQTQFISGDIRLTQVETLQF